MNLIAETCALLINLIYSYMWSKSYSTITNEINKEQLWQLFADVNNWHTWDEGIEYATMEGPFEQGTIFYLKPKGGPKVKIQLTEVIKPTAFTDVTFFPLAKMYDAHLFEDTPQGLKITNTITVTGLLGFLFVKLVAKDIIARMPVDVQRQIASAKKL
jgi:hypothetical protein